MKWNNNGIQYRRGCHEFLIAKFNDVEAWFVCRANFITQQTQRSQFKMLGEYLEAKRVEVMKMYNEDDEWTKDNIIVFDRRSNGEYWFYKLHDDGSMVKLDID